MSLLIDIAYLHEISSRLERFTNKGGTLYNFRCNYCGDSQKKKSKSRAYLYAKDNDLYFRCHNCNVSTTFSKFLQHIDPILHKRYVFERFFKGETGNHNYQKPILPSSDSMDAFRKRIKDPYQTIELESIESLDPAHYARVYLENRKIPKEFFTKLFYTNDFKKYVSTIDPEKAKDLPRNESRIVIPFFDKKGNYLALQGRALENSLRYITIKLHESNEKIYGLDRLNIKQTVRIVEGPLDSLFLKNSLAVCGSDLATLCKKYPDAVYIFDNESANREITKKIEQLINGNYKVVIWDKNLKSKDINDMVLAGMDVEKLVNENTYKSLEAKLRFGKWRNDI